MENILGQLNEHKLDFNLFLTLVIISNDKVPTHRRAEGWVSLLIKRELVEINHEKMSLTAKGQEILNICQSEVEFKEPEKSEEASILSVKEPVKEPEKFKTKLHQPTGEDYKALEAELKAKMMELRKSPNVLINNSTNYYFLCNAVELETRISKVMKLHKLSDFGKIKRVILQYFTTAARLRFSGVRQLKYWILSQDGKGSDMATAYEMLRDDDNKGGGSGGSGETPNKDTKIFI